MFTCIECEKQFHHTQMDLDERACYECLEGTEVHSSRVLSSFGTYVYYISDNEPNLEQLQSIVGGNIEVAYDDGDMQIICNEEGKINGMPINTEATIIWEEKLRKLNSNPSYVMPDVLVGDVIICTDKGKLT